MSSLGWSHRMRKNTGKTQTAEATLGIPLKEFESKDKCVITLHDEPPDLSREKPTTSLEFLDHD